MCVDIIHFPLSHQEGSIPALFIYFIIIFYYGKIHTTKNLLFLTIFKCPVQGREVHSHCCATIPNTHLQNFFITPN